MGTLLEAFALARQWTGEPGPLVVLFVLLWRIEVLRRSLAPTARVVRVLELGHSGDPAAHRELPKALATVKVKR